MIREDVGANDFAKRRADHGVLQIDNDGRIHRRFDR